MQNFFRHLRTTLMCAYIYVYTYISLNIFTQIRFIAFPSFTKILKLLKKNYGIFKCPSQAVEAILCRLLQYAVDSSRSPVANCPTFGYVCLYRIQICTYLHTYIFITIYTYLPLNKFCLHTFVFRCFCN